jgi:hypothetical protein
VVQAMTSKKAKPSKQQAPAVPVNKARQLALVMREGQTEDKAKAEMALGPELANASTFVDFTKNIFPDISLQECIEVMRADIKAVNGGNLDKLEGMLTAQAEALNAMFNQMAKKSIHAEYLPQMETFMRMALKAQSQCRTTVETIAEIKFPKSATFIRQANIANQQQVNNGHSETNTRTHAQAGKVIDSSTELLNEVNHAALDTGRTAAAIGLDKGLAALEAVDRTKDRNRQG